jgi:hypothetical protein
VLEGGGGAEKLWLGTPGWGSSSSRCHTLCRQHTGPTCCSLTPAARAQTKTEIHGAGPGSRALR